MSSSATMPWIIAHRGASRDRPENTLCAFGEALAQGADGLELDLQLSLDGVPVVYHDRTLHRAGGGRRRVHRLPLVELRKLEVGPRLAPDRGGPQIPTLEEVLARYGGRTLLLLEIKTREGRHGRDRHRQLAVTACRLALRARSADRTMMLSFDADVLEACRETAPGLRRVLNVESASHLSAETRRLLPSLHAVSANVRRLSPAFGAAVREGGCSLLAYTCNNGPQVDRALGAGAVALMTDRPGWMGHRLGRGAA